MRIRTLETHEYHRLEDLPGHSRTGIPDPPARVVVAEDDSGVIRGYLILQLMCVAEPIYISPAHRNGTIAFRLFKEALRVLREEGVDVFYVHTNDDAIADYYRRLGFRDTGWRAFEKEVA